MSMSILGNSFEMIVHTGRNAAAWGHTDRYALHKEIGFWVPGDSTGWRTKGHRVNPTPWESTVGLETVFITVELMSFACHLGFLFSVQPYARNLPGPKLAQCHHHTSLWGAGLLIQDAFLIMKKKIAFYLAMLSEDCSDNDSGNHKIKAYSAGHSIIVNCSVGIWQKKNDLLPS